MHSNRGAGESSQPNPRTSRRSTATADNFARRTAETYGKHYTASKLLAIISNYYIVLGTKIGHTELDWGGSFPGSHDFYRTRDEPEEEVFILKPKPEEQTTNGKRGGPGLSSRKTKKKSNGLSSSTRV